MFAPPRNHHVIVICLEDSAHLYQERGGVHEAGPVLRGDVIIQPAASVGGGAETFRVTSGLR